MIQTISEEARAWLQFFLERVDSKTQQENEAISSLIDALRKTVRYIGDITKDSASKSSESEDVLSKIWSETAKKIRPFNSKLAEKCFFKGIYWADNERFTEEEIVKLGFKIETMKQHVSSAIESI